MRPLLRAFSGVSISLFCAAAASAQVIIADPPQTTVFNEPAEYCFPQTSVHTEVIGTGSVILRFAHILLIANEDQGRPGDIFVGARFRNKPDELWLLTGGVWGSAETNRFGWPVVYTRFDERLPPLANVAFWYDPEALAARGEGEIWVGYGLRNETRPGAQAFQESFDEMVRSKRYSLLWDIEPASTPMPGEYRAESAELCLKATEMTRTVFR